MTDYKEKTGNLITSALNGEFNVIAHGCNCFNQQGAGIAVAMKNTFQTDKFEMELSGKGDMLKLGNIDFETVVLGENAYWSTKDGKNHNNEPEVIVVNAYTQYKYGRNHADGVKNPIDYEAITMCFRKMNYLFKGLHIGLPQIGAGLAGGNWNTIHKIILKEFTDCKVTVVIFDKTRLF